MEREWLEFDLSMDVPLAAIDLRRPLNCVSLEAADMTLMRIGSICAWFGLAAGVALAAPKPVPTCKVTFSVAYLDWLNNLNTEIPAANLKDIQKRLSEFGDVCYSADPKAGLIFFIHTTPAVYHGTHVYTNNSSSAAAAGADGSAAAAAASSSSTTAVPYSVDYSVFILDIEETQPDATFKILRTLDQKGLYHTIYGIGYGKGKHPLPNVIEAGAQWLHDDYLGNRPKAKW
jgi:hypothetical protein